MDEIVSGRLRMVGWRTPSQGLTTPDASIGVDLIVKLRPPCLESANPKRIKVSEMETTMFLAPVREQCPKSWPVSGSPMVCILSLSERRVGQLPIAPRRHRTPRRARRAAPASSTSSSSVIARLPLCTAPRSGGALRTLCRPGE